jgi:hypothetical protein
MTLSVKTQFVLIGVSTRGHQPVTVESEACCWAVARYIRASPQRYSVQNVAEYETQI